MGSHLRMEFLFSKRRQVSRAPIIAWVGTIRPESTREDLAINKPSRDENGINQGTYRTGEEGEEPTM